MHVEKQTKKRCGSSAKSSSDSNLSFDNVALSRTIQVIVASLALSLMTFHSQTTALEIVISIFLLVIEYRSYQGT